MLLVVIEESGDILYQLDGLQSDLLDPQQDKENPLLPLGLVISILVSNGLNKAVIISLIPCDIAAEIEDGQIK